MTSSGPSVSPYILHLRLSVRKVKSVQPAVVAHVIAHASVVLTKKSVIVLSTSRGLVFKFTSYIESIVSPQVGAADGMDMVLSLIHI